MSLGIKVTLIAFIVYRFIPSKRLPTYASATSCKVRRVVVWNHNSPFCCWAISTYPLHKWQLLDEEAHWFLEFWNFSQDHSARLKLSPFFKGILDVFLSPFPLLFFFYLLCPWSSLSPLSGTLHHFPIFIFQINLLLFMYSITPTILLIVLFLLRQLQFWT